MKMKKMTRSYSARWKRRSYSEYEDVTLNEDTEEDDDEEYGEDNKPSKKKKSRK